MHLEQHNLSSLQGVTTSLAQTEYGCTTFRMVPLSEREDITANDFVPISSVEGYLKRLKHLSFDIHGSCYDVVPSRERTHDLNLTVRDESKLSFFPRPRSLLPRRRRPLTDKLAACMLLSSQSSLSL